MLSIFSCVCEPSVCQTDFQGSAVLAHITLILLNNGPKAQDESCWQFRCSLTVPDLYIKLYHRYVKKIYIYEKNIVCVCVCVCVYIYMYMYTVWSCLWFQAWGLGTLSAHEGKLL